MAGTLPPATGLDHSAAKAALNNLTLSLTKAAAGDNITVNAVSPGTIYPPKLEAAFRSLAVSNSWADCSDDWAEISRAVLPQVASVRLGKVGDTRDIAYAVAFLSSPLAGYSTGMDLLIDDGMMPAI